VAVFDRRYLMVTLSRSTRRLLSDCSFALGSIWGAAGALKLIFGVSVTFPLFPPIDLERVAPIPAIAIALGLFALGAWLGRSREPLAGRAASGSLGASHDTLFATERAPESEASAPPRMTPIDARPGSAPLGS
jgi:hypothetical protein